MRENGKPLELHEALLETEKELPPEFRERKVLLPQEVPPPPRDWVSHPVTKSIGWLILLGIAVVAGWRAPYWWNYVKEHSFEASIVGVALFAGIFLIIFAFWRVRALGERGDAYWYIESSKRRKRER